MDYKFSLEDIIKFGLSKNVDFHKEGVIERGYDTLYNKKVWTTQWIIEDEKTGNSVQVVCILDGDTGEILSNIKKTAPIRMWM